MKKTPFGLIPDAWKIGDVANVGKVITGSTPPTKDASNYGTDIPFVTPKEVGTSRYVGETSRGLSNAGGSKARLLPANTVVFVCIGSTIGKVSQISCESATNQQINAITCNGSNDPGFLYYQLDFQAQRIRQFAGKQAVPIISKGLFEQVPLLFPPLPEQKKIAEILGACDEAIEAQERLIAQKQQRKKGLMQQLLTGKTRFPKFVGKPWREVQLGEIYRKEKGKAVKASDQGLPLIGSVAFDSDPTEYSGDPLGVRCSKNDLLILWDGEYAGKTTTGKEGIVSSTVAVGRPKQDIETRFIEACLKLENPRIRAIAEGSGIPHMPGDFFDWMRIRLPCKEEQSAIASVLSAGDEEITFQQTKLEQLKQQKKGLMQQLLTGKVRVKV